MGEWSIHVDKLADLNPGQEVELIIKDLTPGVRKYESQRVLGVVSKSETGQGDRLRVLGRTGVPYPEAYWIRILEERRLVPTKF
jgi:hypothetical protein